MSKTVVGLFNTYAKAQQVKQELVAQGYESQNVTVVANDDAEVAGTGTASGTGTGSNQGTGIGERISNYFRNLTGGDDTAHNHYATGVNQGGALLAVTVNDPQAAETASLLTQHGAREIEGEYAASSAAGASYSTGSSYDTTSAVSRGDYAATATPATGLNTTDAVEATAIPIVEEELVVGKREVDRGGVRIYSHVTERPVEANVVLHEESINVERRAVNRPATAADFAAGSTGTIELRATGEEAVVGKASRVVEEVLVGKQATDRTEAVHDTVRKTEVEVEQLGTTGTTASTEKTGY